MKNLNTNIFNILLKYHGEKNLAKCAPYIKDGVIYSPANHYKPIKEGKENKEYAGITIFKNGDTLLNKLKERRYVNPKAIDEFEDISTLEKFFDFLDSKNSEGDDGEEDGVYIFESKNKKIARVSKIYCPESPIENKIPLDFIYFNGMNGSVNPWNELYRKLGNKTRLAIDLTHLYNDVEAYQIKRSGYTQLGMGKVTHFNKNGLSEEFFFMHNPEQNLFIYPEQKIIGVYRSYNNKNGDLFREEKVITL